MRLRPMAFCTVKPEVVPEAEGEDLLLPLFKRKFVVISHADIFLGLLILFCWDMDR